VSELAHVNRRTSSSALAEKFWASSIYVELHIMQRIFSSATRRETLGKHLKVIAAAVS
jgi:hypothetical protein